MLSNRAKFKFFLNLEWIFERLAHEKSFEYYSTESHPLRIYSNNYILNLIKKTDSVIDIGCHAGQITSVIASKAKEVIGIDYNSEAINLANKVFKKDNLIFLNDDVKNFLKGNSKSFDVLILSHILEHLEDPKQIIIDCKPFVNYMYIELPDFDKSYMNHYRYDLKCDLIYTDIDHVNEFDRIEMKALINDTGFTIIESEFRFGVQRHWCKKNIE
ncbi:MAG: class I SAM-dependent methyltransferase [Bacteroidota bacterium]